jgi:hypothetical protein
LHITRNDNAARTRPDLLIVAPADISNRAKNHIVRHSAAQLRSSYCEREHQPHFASQYLFIAHHVGQIRLRTHFLRAAYRACTLEQLDNALSILRAELPQPFGRARAITIPAATASPCSQLP